MVVHKPLEPEVLEPAHEDNLNDLVLFASHDLSASFKQVYDQVFHHKPPNQQNEEVQLLIVGAVPALRS